MTDMTGTNVVSKVYKFAVVPKETMNPFYDQVSTGCMEQASVIGDHVNCVYTGPDHVNATEQAEIVRNLIASGTVDGISMAVIDVDLATELAQEAFENNIPFITFDSDAPLSKRLMYVGTDNVAFGESLGKVLLQLKPGGGRFGVIQSASPNVLQRVEGLRKRLTNSKWVEVEESPKDCLDINSLAQSQMYDYAKESAVNAIIPVGAWPMRDEDNWKKYVDTYRNITNVVADTDPGQLDLLAKVYVDGLVGQVPYQMGSLSVAKLLELAQGQPVVKELLPTSLLEVVQIPLLLPAAALDNNYIGNLKIVGLTLSSVIILMSVAFTTWTLINRKRKVIKASQPAFLAMISTGVLFMGSAIIPLSFDDSNPDRSATACTVGCMAVPWLICLGFCIAFSALFSKTWRINRIFKSKDRFVKVKVTERDVMIPFIVLLFLNILVLSLWSALAPLHYVRLPNPGTDDWNRVISTYGACQSETDRKGGSVPYLVILGAINLGVIIMANVQAYQARGIQSEFSESKYIALVMASFLQSICIGCPILFLVNDNPQAYYLVMVFMIFLTCMAILLLIFVPKFMFARMYSEDRSEDNAAPPNLRGSVPSSAFYEKPAVSRSHNVSSHSVRKGSSSLDDRNSQSGENSSKENPNGPNIKRAVSHDGSDLDRSDKPHVEKRSWNADTSEEKKGEEQESGGFIRGYSEYELDQVAEEDIDAPMESEGYHSMENGIFPTSDVEQASLQA